MIIDSIFNRLEVEIKKTYYIFDRYKSISTFALIYYENILTPEELGKFVRISDKFIRLDDNHYFIIFTFTSQENTFKACQNILLDLDTLFNNRSTCIAIDNFDTDKSAKVVYSRLMQILAETKKNSYTRIEDENILNTNY